MLPPKILYSININNRRKKMNELKVIQIKISKKEQNI